MAKLTRPKSYKARLELLSDPAHLKCLSAEESARIQGFNEALEEVIHSLIHGIRADFDMSSGGYNVEVNGIDGDSRVVGITITHPIYYAPRGQTMSVTRSFGLTVPSSREALEEGIEVLRAEIVSFHKSLYAFQKAQQLVETESNLGPLPEHKHK